MLVMISSMEILTLSPRLMILMSCQGKCNLVGKSVNLLDFRFPISCTAPFSGVRRHCKKRILTSSSVEVSSIDKKIGSQIHTTLDRVLM